MVFSCVAVVSTLNVLTKQTNQNLFRMSESFARIGARMSLLLNNCPKEICLMMFLYVSSEIEKMIALNTTCYNCIKLYCFM